MNVDLFDFELPTDRIALRPAHPRDAARLLVLDGDATRDLHVTDLPGQLRHGDLLVFNDTRVIPAQLDGRRGDAKIGATLHKREGPRRWRAFVRNARRLRDGDVIDFGHGVSAAAVDRGDDGSHALEFAGDEPVELLLERAGHMPLPPYIAGKRPTDERDASDYQTMFAAEPGAVAAPTAALHFTPGLMTALDAAGIGHATLTLHVGAGTFLPVKATDTTEHRMHAEWGRIDAATADRLNAVRRGGGRVIAVGTTSLRLIESATDDSGTIQPFEGDTAIFITPGYRFRGIDGLMTNFHLPRSTLFMLVSALMGREAMRAAYAHAIAQGYRFYSYGDASLLLPGDNRMMFALLLLAAGQDIVVTAPGKPNVQTPATLVIEPAAMFVAACDADGDGETSRRELEACVEKTFAGVDTAKSGSIGYLAYSDWALKWLGDRTALPSPYEVDRDGDDRITLAELQAQFSKLFSRYDKDRDGAVTRAETLTIRATAADANGPRRGGPTSGKKGERLPGERIPQGKP